MQNCCLQLVAYVRQITVLYPSVHSMYGTVVTFEIYHFLSATGVGLWPLDISGMVGLP